MNEVLKRLKNSINKDILNKLDITQMEQLKFVPLCVKENFLFVAIIESVSDIKVISTKLHETFPNKIKYIPVSEDDLNELLSFLKTEMQKDNTDDGTFKQVKLGELLIQKGYINDIQLLQALAESKRQRTPIGSTLFKLGFITLEQLKEILHLQTGYDLVTPEQLASQDKYVKMLPEDFIRANKIIPISSDGKTLILGVVTPVKPDVLKDIIYMTGQNPKQL